MRETELLEEELLETELDTELDTETLEGITLDATAELMATDETAAGLDLLLPLPPPPPPPQPTNSSALPRITP